jgi:hypothetical protein
MSRCLFSVKNAKILEYPWIATLKEEKINRFGANFIPAPQPSSVPEYKNL